MLPYFGCGNSAAVNMGLEIALETVISFPSDVYPVARLLDHLVALFNFFEEAPLFSPVAIPTYIPTNSA